jgi:fluoroacetyl-CoA thioesterase
MRESLAPGVQFEFRYPVPQHRTVPHLLPESPEFTQMPEVLASGYMVGIIEWACIQAINPHLEWPAEQTVGVGFALSHVAATPPGLTVRVRVQLTEVQGRRLTFAVEADDGVDIISQGTHERFVIDAAKFSRKVAAKGAGSAAGKGSE